MSLTALNLTRRALVQVFNPNSLFLKGKFLNMFVTDIKRETSFSNSVGGVFGRLFNQKPVSPGTEEEVADLISPKDHKIFGLPHSENLSKSRDRIKAEIERCVQIQELFRSGVLILDEVDIVLHPLFSELNWPIDQKNPLEFTEQGERWTFVLHLLNGLLAAIEPDPPIPRAYRESEFAKRALTVLGSLLNQGIGTFNLQSVPHLVLLDMEFYHKYIRPLLIPWVLLYLRSQGLLSVISEEKIKESLTEGSFKIALSNMSDAAGERHKMFLRLAIDWLHIFLPHILTKVNRIGFGLLDTKEPIPKGTPESRRLLAIPFVGKDVPSLTTEFAHPDMVIGLTILAYRFSGLRESDFERLIKRLREQLTSEVGPVAYRKTSQLYIRWIASEGRYVKGYRLTDDGEGLRDSLTFGDSDLPLLSKLRPSQYHLVYPVLRRNAEAISWYLDKVVFPVTMHFSGLKISASGQEIGSSVVFGKRLGFSGTPSSLLPLEFGDCRYQRGDDGRMIHFLSSRSIVSTANLKSSWSPHYVLELVGSGNFNALIDAGALVTGMTNYQVACFLLHKARMRESIDGIVFLDQQNRKRVAMRAASEAREGTIVVEFENCGIPPSRLFTFFDQIHTTGTDIRQAARSVAALTIGKDLTFRDYAQAAFRFFFPFSFFFLGVLFFLLIFLSCCFFPLLYVFLTNLKFRLRGIGKGQRIHVLLPPEVSHLILNRDEVPSPVALLKWLTKNSLRSEVLQAGLLYEQQLANVYRKRAHKLIMANQSGDSGPSSKAGKLFLEAVDMELLKKSQAPGCTGFRALQELLGLYSLIIFLRRTAFFFVW